MDYISRHNVKVSGTGDRTIVFAHGYGCDQNMWRNVAPHFEKDFRVVLFDLMGSGGSDTSDYTSLRYNSLDAYADDVIGIARALEIKDAVFVGHSVSSMIGVLAAKKDATLFGELVLVAPSPRYINDKDYIGGMEKEDVDGLLESLAGNYLGWSSAITPVIMGNADRPELSEELKNSFCRMNPEIAKNFARVTFLSDNRKDLESIEARTLILQCSDDAIAPMEVGQYLAEHIKNSRLVVLKATGHCPNLSAPEETTRAIQTFLNDGRN